MNKKLLSTAVGASLAATVGLAQAGHDGLIPYVVKDTNRTTVVTIIGDGVPVKDGAHMHLQYWTKSTTAANTAACDPSSVYVPFTDEDIMTFDTAGILGYPLFGDTTNPSPLGTSISYAAPRHGYLAVENESGNLHAMYWLELDLANGGAHGDRGYVNRDSGENNFTGASDHVVLRYDTISAVAFWPSSVASTVFTVTPAGTDMRTKENNQVVLQVFNNQGVQGAYDRNENGVDGTVPVTVRCVGRVTPAQLMPGVVANVAWAAQGGWGWMVNLGDNNASGTSDFDAFIYQVDQASVGGKFVSNATRVTSDDLSF